MIYMLIINVLTCLSLNSFAVDNLPKYNPLNYPDSEFIKTTNQYKHGQMTIDLIQVKRVTFDSQTETKKSPYTCKTWTIIRKGQDTVFTAHLKDIDAVGFSYGWFVGKTDKSGKYFMLIKNGDYDGQLILIEKTGKLHHLKGGFYFYSRDGRFLFSEYSSDDTYLTVFDLIKGRIVFSERPSHHTYNWYETKGRIGYTASYWEEGDGTAREKFDSLYVFELQNGKIISTPMPKKNLLHSIKYDFDPRKYEDCICPKQTK